MGKKNNNGVVQTIARYINNTGEHRNNVRLLCEGRSIILLVRNELHL